MDKFMNALYTKKKQIKPWKNDVMINDFIDIQRYLMKQCGVHDNNG